jgi:hypothetical protein
MDISQQAEIFQERIARLYGAPPTEPATRSLLPALFAVSSASLIWVAGLLSLGSLVIHYQ